MKLKELIHFLNQLENSNIFYKVDKVRDEAIMVEIAVPGQRWEVEFLENGIVSENGGCSPDLVIIWSGMQDRRFVK